MVKAQRGPHGGHTLALDPEDIRLSEVMECLGSSENLVYCLDDTAVCIHAPSCAQREVWQEVEYAVYRILESRTIGHLVDRSHEILRNRASGTQTAVLHDRRN